MQMRALFINFCGLTELSKHIRVHTHKLLFLTFNKYYTSEKPFKFIYCPLSYARNDHLSRKNIFTLIQDG